MKYIKENLILFQLAIALLIGGIFSIVNFDRYTPITTIIIALAALIIGLIILWKGFITKINKD